MNSRHEHLIDRKLEVMGDTQ
ncbi:unnamed protein product [Chondrus crispus]|uniref:Uncharacterized protein n=1 Tax=Chondrus crispus TaxID=2769 RepID=R7QVD4_CHOCR|nr:unnamed protein product [Chondrus crispus]CDF41305.1 unnamed protein product [Chondrus crispus]|eukprot:XP_005711599.1 unnamed protein product [Chondrus crispus]